MIDNVPDKGVSEGGFAVIDVSNDGHVTDVLLFVHDLTDLVNCKVNHLGDLCPPLAENKNYKLMHHWLESMQEIISVKLSVFSLE